VWALNTTAQQRLDSGQFLGDRRNDLQMHSAGSVRLEPCLTTTEGKTPDTPAARGTACVAGVVCVAWEGAELVTSLDGDSAEPIPWGGGEPAAEPGRDLSGGGDGLSRSSNERVMDAAVRFSG